MLEGETTTPQPGREARVARTGRGREDKNSLALPKGNVFVMDELGRPLKQLAVKMRINDRPARDARTDDYGRLYPLASEIDRITVEVEAHETAAGNSIATDSGQHFERGGDGPTGA